MMPSRIVEELEIMLAELESNQLVVALVPTKRYVCEGGCIRVAVNKNATWYRKFAAGRGSSRTRRNSLFDTCIKRRDTVTLLGRLITGSESRSKYASELVAIAARRAAQERVA